MDTYGIRKTKDDRFEGYVTHPLKLTYTSTADEIFWESFLGSYKYTLYRKTLMISVRYGKKTLPTIQCELHTSEKILSLLNRRVEERQIEFEKGIVGNKI